EVVFSRKKKNERRAALLNELTGHDQTIPTVVAFPAENSDRQCCKVVLESILENFRHAHAGVFHQNEAGNSVFFRSKTVYFADLLGSKDLHGQGSSGL